MADKYLKQFGGQFAEQEALQASAGAGDAGKIPALDAAGKVSQTMMPTGVGPDVKNIMTSEGLADGDLVNVWNDAGTGKVRKADASTSGKEAHGFVRAAYGNGVLAEVHFEGSNPSQTGMTAGPVFLSDVTPGRATNAIPAGTGKIVQRVGFAVSATELNFDVGVPIVLA